MESLQKELAVINKEIKRINKKYINIRETEDIRTYQRQLMEYLEAANDLLGPYFKVLPLPYELLAQDALIDIFITVNSFDIQDNITSLSNTTIYPLVFPYAGVRGTRGQIEQFFSDYLEKTDSELISYIWGNEPIEITPWKFKSTSIMNPSTSPDGTGTLIGIIDTGIDYTNPAFMDQNGETKIQRIWDQTIGVDSPYGFGTVYDQETINIALRSPDPFEVVPHKDEWGHGTILAGIAAGSGVYEEGNYKGVAPGAQLIIVKLKPANDAMQGLYHGKYNPLGFSSLDIALAFQYMVGVSGQMNRPISICLPSGTNSGSHDGNDILDSIISSYSSNSGITTVISVGEEANKNHHASGDLRERNEQEIRLDIAQGQGGFIADIWASFGDQIEVTLTPPKVDKEVFSDILLNKGQITQLTEDSSVWSGGVKLDDNTGSQLIHFRFNNPIPGQWIIKIKGIIVIEGHYNMWIPKTGMILPGTVLSPANPFTTISNASTTRGIIGIGCWDTMSLSACTSSGRGFTRDNRVSPDYIVDGVDVPGPLPDNKWGQITGTAPSAAITVGVTSLIYEDQLVEEGNLANTVIMKATLTKYIKKQPTVAYPNPSSGYGVIDMNLDLS